MLREGPRLPATAQEAPDWSHTAIYTALPGHRAVVFDGTPHDAELVRLVAGRPDKPGRQMDVKEANVFHLDADGRAYEFWGVADDQAAINSFWMD